MESSAGLDSRAACETALYQLLQSTLRYERLTAEQDTEISKIQHRYAGRLRIEGERIANIELNIEAFYRANREKLELDGLKSVQMANGLLGMRAPANPALVPLDQKWTWPTIRAKVILTWKKRFLLPPKPELDKVKLKKTLTDAELKACGMRLDTDETFYYDLNRLEESAEMTEAA